MLPHSEKQLDFSTTAVFKIVSVRSKNAFCVCESVRNLPKRYSHTIRVPWARLGPSRFRYGCRFPRGTKSNSTYVF
jgi:hypothetical protein